MPSINVDLGQFPVGGPFSYSVFRNAVGVKVAGGLPTLAAAWNAIRDDLAAQVGAETVVRIVVNVTTREP